MPKWEALGDVADKSLADIDPDTIDNIYDEAELGVPPKGPYLFNLKRLQGVESKAGDPMLKCVLELAEPKGTKKARYNGYSIWFYQLSTKERAGGVNGLLHALLDGKPLAQRKKIIEAYWSGNVVLDEQKFVKKIGTWIVPESVLIGANTKLENSTEYGERLTVAFNGIMPASDRPASKATADVEEDDVEEEGDEDEEVQARQDELTEMTTAKLKAEAKKAGVTVKRGMTDNELIEAILDVEFPIEDESEDEADDEPEEDDEPDETEEEDEPEGDEFDEMDRAALKKYNTAEKLGVKVTTKMSDDELRDAIRAALPDDEPEEDDDDDEEPEPTPAPRRGRAKATAAAPGRAAAKRRKGSDDEPPF